jgi:hypothetical protein
MRSWKWNDGFLGRGFIASIWGFLNSQYELNEFNWQEASSVGHTAFPCDRIRNQIIKRRKSWPRMPYGTTSMMSIWEGQYLEKSTQLRGLNEMRWYIKNTSHRVGSDQVLNEWVMFLNGSFCKLTGSISPILCPGLDAGDILMNLIQFLLTVTSHSRVGQGWHYL